MEKPGRRGRDHSVHPQRPQIQQERPCPAPKSRAEGRGIVTDEDRQPYTIAINIDAPPSPGYVLELAEAAAEIIRALNHLTRHPEALEFPAEGDQLFRYLESAAERMPQLLDQI